jgi:hypothetical protein
LTPRTNLGLMLCISRCCSCRCCYCCNAHYATTGEVLSRVSEWVRGVTIAGSTNSQCGLGATRAGTPAARGRSGCVPAREHQLPASRESRVESTETRSLLVVPVARKPCRQPLESTASIVLSFAPLALRAWCSTAVSSSTIRLHRRVLIHGRVALRHSALPVCKE